jgi:methionyl-tRNA synthetase
MSYLAPVLPHMAQAAAAFLGTRIGDWSAIATPLLAQPIARYKPLATRLDPEAVASLIAPAPTAAEPEAAAGAPASVSIDEFAKLDLRVARVAAAELVAGSDKLLRLTLDLGGEQRTVLSGIRAAYRPDQLTGRLVVMIANLAPRKMRFGVSQGMVLCAGSEDDPGAVFLLAPDSGAEPGMKVT